MFIDHLLYVCVSVKQFSYTILHTQHHVKYVSDSCFTDEEIEAWRRIVFTIAPHSYISFSCWLPPSNVGCQNIKDA